MTDSRAATTRTGEPATPFAYQMISRVAPRMGVSVELEPVGSEAARLVFPDGRVSFFRHGNLDINGAGSADIARDKYACAHFLRLAGFAVPISVAIHRDSPRGRELQDRLAEFADRHGWCLVVKPNSLYGGRGVERVEHRSALLPAVERVLTMDKQGLVQPFINGLDLRVVVFDGAPIAAYRRVPATVLGDGRRSLRQLVADHYINRSAAALSERTSDRRTTEEVLARRAGGLRRVPGDGEHVPLVDAANVANGAHVEDLTNVLPSAVLALATRAAEAIGLRLAGVDLLADADVAGLASTPADRCVVLELNSAPELDGFASLGDHQTMLVEQLYERVVVELAR